MNLRLLLVVTVLCAVFSDAWAQNRGSARYSAAEEELDGDVTRAQRQPTVRRTSARRRRPTPAPEEPEYAKELPEYQLPSREATTGRRVPSRIPAEEFAPPLPEAPVLPEEPILPAVVDELPQITTAAPGEKTQGRRRRPKKRRRPQNGGAPKPENVDIADPEKNKVPVPELLDTEQRRPQPFSNNPELINNPNTYDFPPTLVENPSWSDDKLVNAAGEPERPRSPEPAPYYPPQVGTNRLPMDDSERIESPRGYSEPSRPVSNQEVPNRRYVPSKPADESPERASYVPVLPPIRVPTEARSRLPSEDYPTSRNQESTRTSDRRSSQRTSSNRNPSVPKPNPDEESRIAAARAPQNFIPHDKQPSIPESLPEVRLPATEQPFLANEYDKNLNEQPSYGNAEEILGDLNEEGIPIVENIDLQGPTTASRHRESSDVVYDSPYSSYNDNIDAEEHVTVPAPHRRQETEPQVPRNTYNDVQPQEPPKRSQTNNNVDIGDSQISRYEPPLQRYGGRGSERSENTRSTIQEDSPTEAPKRGRGSSRYRPEGSTDDFSRTRSSSRSSSDSSSAPVRGRSSQAPSQTPTRSRNTQRYQPDPAESSSRVSTRRQPVNSEYAENPSEESHYRQRAPAPSPSGEEDYNRPPLRGAPANAPEEEHVPVRNAAQSRPPQYETRDAAYTYEELPAEDPNVYEPEYQAPRQQSRREPESQRGPPVREQPERQAPRQSNRNVPHRSAPRQPQPEYNAPPQENNRYQSQPEYDAPPQENTRYQPQYQAPQNVRSQARPTPQRAPPSNQERQPAPRQPSRSRHQEPSPNQGRSSGSGRFSCPEPYGYFADSVQCDKYYECRNGTSFESLCEDGLAFNEASSPKFLRCDSLRDVDCSKRPELQKAKPTKNCPRKYGLYPHESDCTKFWNCVDGAATEVQCPQGLTFNDDRATCDWADLVKSSCKTEDLLGFTCPEPNAHDLQDGVYTTYAHPDNCQLHFFCIKGEDGSRKPRLLTCHEGLVYNPTSKSCARPEEVPGCEDFYGSRSPPPKQQRKPAAREPVEPEEYEEEPPTPKPRRRVQHRRVRN
ncbi:protein obstructor-E [Caerostris extrusa]|uniref:Protein obstructor-E n=1 Tax=Caerostris extrusa TaxID=172846 RepID=A0AAV4Y8K0_CAEEX|nr:protein obstructor-E [Caerostris extrusa]